MPIGRYLGNFVSVGFFSFLILIILLPPYLSLFGFLLLLPLILSVNLFTPGRVGEDPDDWFSFSGDSDPNKALVKILAGLVKIDPAGDQAQKEAAQKFIAQNSPGISQTFLLKIFNDKLSESVDVSGSISELGSASNKNQQKFVLQVIVEIASANGSLTDAEKDYIRKVASDWSVSDSELESILQGEKTSYRNQNRSRRSSSRRTGWSSRGGFGGARGGRRNRRSRNQGSLKEAYRKLDLEPGASKEEVKEAYQQKVKNNHPDQYRDQSQEKVEAAEEEMAEINQAYQRIKNQW